MYGNKMQEMPLSAAIIADEQKVSFNIFSPYFETDIVEVNKELKIISPQEGWKEIDPIDVMKLVNEAINEALNVLANSELKYDLIKCVGIATDRNVTILWDDTTGIPLYNAILKSDNRTVFGDSVIKPDISKSMVSYINAKCGVRPSAYLGGRKIQWMIENIPYAKMAMEKNKCKFGGLDSWIIWNLTKGHDKQGIHVTDVTNAAQTMLMDIKSLNWDPVLCRYFKIPVEILPKIKSSSGHFGLLNTTKLNGIPITAVIGNSQAMLIGHGSVHSGQVITTLNDKIHILCNTGQKFMQMDNGLYTTIAYQLSDDKPVYALEGELKTGNSLLKWATKEWHKDSFDYNTREDIDTNNVCIISSSSGVYVPNTIGQDIRLIYGVTSDTKEHQIAHAAMENICMEIRGLLDSVIKNGVLRPHEIRVNGILQSSWTLLSHLSNITGVPVLSTNHDDLVPIGVAMLASHSIGSFYIFNNRIARHEPYNPLMPADEVMTRIKQWNEVRNRIIAWIDKNSDKPTLERDEIIGIKFMDVVGKDKGEPENQSFSKPFIIFAYIITLMYIMSKNFKYSKSVT